MLMCEMQEQREREREKPDPVISIAPKYNSRAEILDIHLSSSMGLQTNLASWNLNGYHEPQRKHGLTACFHGVLSQMMIL